jgi:uncharacterized protein YdhG (YjbR/CyaY superfamily)
MTPRKSTGAGAADTAAAFTDEERAAMKERARERKAEQRRGAKAERARTEGERDVLAKIADMQQSERAIAARLHQLILESAPVLSPRTWYGMPAYARDGRIVCFFQSADKFKTRYGTLGFTDQANLDDGVMWPTSFAVRELTPDAEDRIAALVRQAVS